MPGFLCPLTDGRGSSSGTPDPHASSHENGGADEINVEGLSGLLADSQTPLSHTHTASDVDSEAATDGYVLTADGVGGAAWEEIVAGIGGTVGTVDGTISRADGVGGATLQGSGLFIGDGTVAAMLQFGGTSSTFPGLRYINVGGSYRGLGVKIADDSGYDRIWASEFTTSSESSTLSTNGVVVGSNKNIGWATSATVGISPTYNARLYNNGSSTAVLLVDGPGTSPRSLLSSVLVEASTAGVGSPNVLAATESGTLLTNEGVTAENHHDLPTASAGLQFEFYSQDSDGMQINAATGDTITTTTGTSATGGFISCAAAGAWIRLVAINATQWVEMGERGTWSIDS